MLPTLISVSGFNALQRFKALSASCPVYFAMPSIDGLAANENGEYCQKGGSNFARWQQHIIDWHRSHYGGLKRAPAVGEEPHLIVSTVVPEPHIDRGPNRSPKRFFVLEKFPENSWLAKLNRAISLGLEAFHEGMHLDASKTAQLTSGSGTASQTQGRIRHA